MIIRNVDTAGRVIIPAAMLYELDLHKSDKVVITLEGKSIKISKYEPKCFFCGAQDDLVRVINKDICCDCINTMNDLVFDNPKGLALKANEESDENDGRTVDIEDSAENIDKSDINDDSGETK